MSFLIVEDLSIRTAERSIVDRISFSVGEGEIFTLLGETGSGKSLIGSALMGLVPKGVGVTGRIVVDGASFEAGDQKSLRGLWGSDTFLLPQEPLAALAPLMAIRDQVAEQFRLGREQRGQGAEAALETMNIEPGDYRKRPDQLSGGMAQRVLAAIASVTRAPLLVADEPTKGLDGGRRSMVSAMFGALRAEGRSILLITHDIALARGLADRAAFLHEGRIAETGPGSVVLSAPSSGYGRRYVASDPVTWPRRPYAPSTSPKIIETSRLRIGFGTRVLADDLNFHCHAGHISALLGASGIGKTTLGRAMLGLTKPVGGRIDRLFPAGSAAQKLHQDPTRVFSPWQSLGRSLEDLRRLPEGDAAAERVPELMRRFALPREILQRRPAQVSGGEAQRAALVRVLALKPKLLVADEPTSRLDPPVQEQVIRYLRQVADEDGLAILLITHDRDLAEAIADRLMLMRGNGKTAARLFDVTRADPRPAN